jgi:MFS family permease
LLLVIAGLLGELYYFTSPIYVDIFINEAGWSQEKYNGIVGGIALLGSVSGQIIGGILGDKYGIRRVAMVSFLVLALANATFAFLEPMWGNTWVMTVYLIGQYFIAGIALICIISLCMRLTWSKVGGTQFTAYMSILNTSVVFAYTLTERMISVFNYSTAIYIGAALTLVTSFFLAFIDENETDRVLEGRWDGDDEFDDLGESPLWGIDEGGEKPVATT